MSYTGSCVAIDSCEVTCWTWPSWASYDEPYEFSQHIVSMFRSLGMQEKNLLIVVYLLPFKTTCVDSTDSVHATKTTAQNQVISMHPSHDHLRVGTIHPRRSFSRITTKLPLLQLWVISKFWATENPAISDQTKLFCSGNSTMMNQQSPMLWPFRFVPGVYKKLWCFCILWCCNLRFCHWFFHILNPGTSWSWVHGRW